MIERSGEITDELPILKINFVDGPSKEDFNQFELRAGHTKKYRGNHRSHVRGKGIKAYLRKLGTQKNL